MKKKYISFLYLEDGSIYQGWSFSNSDKSVGEVVFNTGMTGYQEIMTDPSYHNQMIVFTYPEIGNTGINIFDIESDHFYIKGIISKNICINPSNWRSSLSLVNYLIDYQIPHIFGIDTRHLTKKLRSRGVMVGCISTKKLINSEINLVVQSFKYSSSMHAIDQVTTRKKYWWLAKRSNWFNLSLSQQVIHKVNFLKVVVLDYGVKFNILNRLFVYGCSVIVVPGSTSYTSIIALNPDGILLSNGPGDPSLIDFCIVDTVRKLIFSNIPIFGICLGHQLLALALGARTTKLKFGHRGLNHPSGVYDLVKITSQNHGYVVSCDIVPDKLLDICYVNCNDKTISGIVHKDKPCFSVQYHPEASPGPHDSDFLFSHFVQVMIDCKVNVS